MRTYAAKAVAVFRVVYIVFATLFGFAFTVASVALLWQGIDAAIEFAQCNSTVEPSSIPGGEIVKNCYGIDGPDPLSFDSYGKGPVIAVMFLLIALAALKRRWELLSLPSSFLISFMMVPAVAGVFYDGWGVLLGIESVAWLLVAMAGIGIVMATRMPSNSRTTLVVPMLAVLVAISYFWRAIAVAMSADAARAIETSRGGQILYPDSVELVATSIVGVIAGVILLPAVVLSLRGSRRSLNLAFPFIAGLSFPGFLQALDLVVGLQEGGHSAYAIQDAVAFVACITALVLTRRQRIQTATA